MRVPVCCIAVISFWCLAGVLGFAQPIAAVLPDLSAKEMESLLANQQLFDDVKPGAPVKYAPSGSQGDSLRALASTPDSKIVVQSAFLLKGKTLSDADRLELFNKLLTIDTLSGVTYFSETRNKVTVLFDKVFRVERSGSHEPLANPHVEKVPDQYAILIHIKDANFGSTWYSLAIESNPSSVVISLENTRPLGIMVFRAFDVSGVKIRFTVVPVDEGLLVAGVCAANPSDTASNFVDMFSAIQKRVMAVEGWVLRQVEDRPIGGAEGG